MQAVHGIRNTVLCLEERIDFRGAREVYLDCDGIRARWSLRLNDVNEDKSDIRSQRIGVEGLSQRQERALS